MIHQIKKELKKVIVSQDQLVQSLLITLLSEGHLLIEGYPGVAKTTIIKALSKIVGLTFKRISFTPDLLPSDILGIEIYNASTHTFEVKKGAIFTDLLLADEINRAPAKVQSALLEAMAERQVTIGEKTFDLKRPFMVMATQNPIEESGVYALPQAQLDRFLLKSVVDYPKTAQEEVKILDHYQKASNLEGVNQVATIEDILRLQEKVNEIHIDQKVKEYIANLTLATREQNPLIKLGASPRGSIALLKASKAHALILGKNYVAPSDIKAVIYDVLRHRILLSFEAISQGITVQYVIDEIMRKVRVP
ncbi:MAG: ATPase [Hydrogenimonas sp.]|nr:MAG: ATPase [Hydrogenimonas sp.]